MEETKGAGARLFASIREGSRTGLKTTWYLARIMAPVSLGVAILGWTGALKVLSELVAPALSLIGLRGEAALAIVSSIFLNIYSAIAAMDGLGFSLREITIIAIMTLTAHNMIVETAVMKKTGSSALKMIALRLGAAIFAGWMFNLLLPLEGWETTALASGNAHAYVFPDAIYAKLIDLGWLLAKIASLVIGIMVLQRVLEEFGALKFLSRAFSPLMRAFGLSSDASFLWVVINTAGYAYGAGIIVSEIEKGKMRKQDGDLLNHHAAMCHSLFEDTVLYAALGVPLLWITVPRLILAVVVTWAERLRRFLFKRSLKAGMA
jgi:hypothetical protein